MEQTVATIPPNGFQGAAHQSLAVKHHIAKHLGGRAAGMSVGSGKKRRKARVKGKAAKVSRKRRSGSSKGMKILKAGSAAAKAWGAKMKKHRKKKSAAA